MYRQSGGHHDYADSDGKATAVLQVELQLSTDGDHQPCGQPSKPAAQIPAGKAHLDYRAASSTFLVLI